MEEKTKGAWIIHHCNKLSSVKVSISQFEQLDFAGKSGMLLNGLAASNEVTLSIDRVRALAKASNISTRLELPAILDELERQRLIDRSEQEVAVLGLSTSETLKHIATIYDESEPTVQETSALELAELTSSKPTLKSSAKELISDTYSIPSVESDELIDQFSAIGFVDSEVSRSDKILFNGNLFRKDSLPKIRGVLSSLSAAEEQKVNELLSMLDRSGCISKNEGIQIAGSDLLEKLASIAIVDINVIGNERGTYEFITRPSAFKKFSSADIDDAFDLAKAFVTSLTYGMTSSANMRGRIRMIEALMQKLINGQWVGPATAIGQDYKVLELKGVIQLRPHGGGLYHMKLLKRDVGEIALQVISEGEASTSVMAKFPSVSATKYLGPEVNRTVVRRQQTPNLKRGISSLLDDLRTGGIK